MFMKLQNPHCNLDTQVLLLDGIVDLDQLRRFVELRNVKALGCQDHSADFVISWTFLSSTSLLSWSKSMVPFSKSTWVSRLQCGFRNFMNISGLRKLSGVNIFRKSEIPTNMLTPKYFYWTQLHWFCEDINVQENTKSPLQSWHPSTLPDPFRKDTVQIVFLEMPTSILTPKYFYVEFIGLFQKFRASSAQISCFPH